MVGILFDVLLLSARAFTSASTDAVPGICITSLLLPREVKAVGAAVVVAVRPRSELMPVSSLPMSISEITSSTRQPASFISSSPMVTSFVAVSTRSWNSLASVWFTSSVMSTDPIGLDITNAKFPSLTTSSEVLSWTEDGHRSPTHRPSTWVSATTTSSPLPLSLGESPLEEASRLAPMSLIISSSFPSSSCKRYIGISWGTLWRSTAVGGRW